MGRNDMDSEVTMSFAEFQNMKEAIIQQANAENNVREILAKRSFGLIDRVECQKLISKEIESDCICLEALANEVFHIEMNIDEALDVECGLFFLPIKKEDHWKIDYSSIQQKLHSVFSRDASASCVPYLDCKVWPGVVEDKHLLCPAFWEFGVMALCSDFGGALTSSDMASWLSSSEYGLIPISVVISSHDSELEGVVDGYDKSEFHHDCWSSTESFVSSLSIKRELEAISTEQFGGCEIELLTCASAAIDLLGSLESSEIAEEVLSGFITEETSGQSCLDLDGLQRFLSYNTLGANRTLREYFLGDYHPLAGGDD